MREYKFRAWDKKKNKMLYLSPNDTILFKNGKCTVWKENQYYETEECFCCETFNNVIPMLYSGRKDKNGKEIYEADIVLYDRNIHKDIDIAKFKVVWAKDRYVLQEIKHKYYIDDVAWELVEVIGNIYENPELLKENG